jgi:hypothetical protein
MTGVHTDRDHFETGGPRSQLRAARLRAVAMVGPWAVPALAPPAGGERALAGVSSRRALGSRRVARGPGRFWADRRPRSAGPDRPGPDTMPTWPMGDHSGAKMKDLSGSAQSGDPETGTAARRWRSATR